MFLILRRNSTINITLLLLLCMIITSTLQNWVGEKTIYSDELKGKRLLLHKGIYSNTLPQYYIDSPGGEHSRDFQVMKRRILVVYLVEYLNRLSGVSIHAIYRTIDSIFLFLCLISIFFYLRRWVDYHYCLIGILYTGVVFVMTYYFHHYHPWDRISLFSWIALLYLIREKRDILFGLLLIISITIKYDVKVLSLLYIFYNYYSTSDRSNRSKVLLKGLLLLTMAFGFDEFMKYLLQVAGHGETALFRDIVYRIFTNMRMLVAHNVSYPPLLMFAIPGILSLLYWNKKHIFVKSSVAFAFILLIIHVSLANCREVRAETMILVLLLPSALLSLRFLLEETKSK